MEQIKLGKIAFALREKQDFSWLLEIGEPFCVFSQNDSGNVSFGVTRGDEKFFVKYAGAKTTEYGGDPEDAVDRLRRAAPLYRELAHPNLIRLVRTIELPQGLALVFRWAEGGCLHAHWSFDACPKFTDPESPYVKFRALSLEKKRAVAEALFDFLCYVESRGYAAVDFYDSSILYDFAADTVTFCDIDLFRKKPVVNDLGADWPCSPRFKAPEEYEQGAGIDSDTNVFTLGKLLLFFLAGEDHPDREHWEDTEARWQAVQKALSPRREDRFPSLLEFWEAWKRGGPEKEAPAVREIFDSAEKQKIARDILEALPDWFGIESSREEYIEKSGKLPFAAVCREGKPVGFLALQETSPYTAEICVMGVLPGEHRHGGGRALVEWAKASCREKGYEFLQVKTLDASAKSEAYARTRAFYKAMGFRELECFPTLWDEANPCLVMIQALAAPKDGGTHDEDR